MNFSKWDIPLPLSVGDPANQNRTSTSSFDALKLNILDSKCAGCHGASAPTAELPTPPSIPSSTVYRQIQTKNFDASCVRCRSGTRPSGKVDLSNYQKMMTNKKNGFRLEPKKKFKGLTFEREKSPIV